MKRKLVLENRRVFHGEGFGSPDKKIAEIVFNTSMVGYQEILSDPSYCDQIVVMTYPLIGNYGLAQELKHGINVSGFIAGGGSMYDAILMIFDTLPLPIIALVMLVITMIAFYSTTLDGITYVTSSYSYKQLSADQEPDRRVRTFWSILLILFPIALLFAENSLYSIQSVTIIAAAPVVILSVLCAVSFFKDASLYMKELKKESKE